MYTPHQSMFKSSKDDFPIFYQKWTPAQVRRVCVIQHGFGEHSGRYQNILNAFDGTGTAFYALDARGHGKTGGKRGHVDQFQMYVDDLADLIQIARKENMNDQVYLLGHSLGGVIVLQYSLQGTNQSNLEALIVSSPGLIIEMDAGKTIKKNMATLFASILPAVTLDANLDLTYISHDPVVVEAYKNDPLVHGKISFQMGSNLFSIGKSILEKANHLTVPVYIFQGTGDKIVSPESSKALYAGLTTADKTLKLYEGLYHETMNELEADRNRVLADLKEWFERH
ncbi:MAG: lysophospholipase [Spirochaetia bacterium]|nr:lysophospholipase [Spirochaetia bacterium]